MYWDIYDTHQFRVIDEALLQPLPHIQIQADADSFFGVMQFCLVDSMSQF